MLAILLEKMQVPYHIFERAPKAKPRGKNNRLNIGIKNLPISRTGICLVRVHSATLRSIFTFTPIIFA